MLNELEDLRKSLAAQGIQTAPWHPSLQPLRKGPAVIVELDGEGSPIQVTGLPPEQALELRNIQPDNQNRFPAFNVNAPLFKVGRAGNEAALGLDDLDALIASAPLTWDEKKDSARIQRSLGFFNHELAVLLKSGDAATNPLLGSTHALFRALAKSTLDAERFLRAFALAACRSVRLGNLDNDLLLQILFGKLNRTGGRDTWQLLIYLDIADPGGFSHRVADPAVAVAWSQAMLSATILKSGTSTTLKCSLSGDLGESVGEKMPSPNLPLLGGTYLMAMNADIPAQTRYRKTSTDVFPMAKKTVQELNDSLLHITAPGREGKTWGPVSNGTRDKPDLLIVYLEKDTEGALRLASMLGDDEDWEEDGESSDEPNKGDSGTRFNKGQSSFESRTKNLLEAIQLNPELMQGDTFLRVFVISTIDKGRKQVLFDRRYSVSALFRAQERWITGSRNTPLIEVSLPQSRGKKARIFSGHVPTPVAVLRSLRQQWIRAGTMSQTVPGVDLRRIYNLLIEENVEREAMWMLERLLPLSQALVMAAGRPYINQKRTGEMRGALQVGAALSVEARRSLLTVVALYGILLHRLGRNKEKYMEGRDYLLGQFLQCADELHLLYCEHVRNGSVPSQLIGNAALPMALENPAKALEVLCARVPVYVAWLTQRASAKIRDADDGTLRTFAEMNETEKSALRAKSLRRRIGELSAELKGKLDAPVSLTGRAELLLGYLAREPKTNGSPQLTSDLGSQLNATGENA